ncbi:MAG: MFS transporter [Deltaproteobacteria bacterium]|nr:MFS transporter [Deltaproteobacteria bacterium]
MKEDKIFYGYWIVAAIFIISAYISGIIYFGFTAIFEPIANEFGWSYASVSLAASIRGMEIGLLAPVVGLLFDRVGPRRLIFFGGTVTGLGIMLLSRISSLSAFYGAFVLIASGVSTCVGIVPVTVVGHWFYRKVSLFTGIVVSGIAMGGLMVPMVTWVIDAVGWRTAMAIFGLGTWIIVLPLSLIVRHSPEAYGYGRDGMGSGGGSVLNRASENNVRSEKEAEKIFEIRDVIKSPLFWHFQFGFICHVFVVHAVLTHVMPYLSSIDISRATSGLVASGIPIISIFGRLGAGWFGDRFSKRMVISVCFVLTSLSLLWFAFIDRIGAWTLIPFLILFCIGYGGTVPMISALLMENFGRARLGSIVGLSQGLAMIGSVSGQPLAGWVFDTYGRYQEAWIAYAVVVAVGTISVVTIPKLNKLEMNQ